MKILRTRNLKCGAVRLSLEAEDEEIKLILVEGIRRFIKESNLIGVIVSTSEIDSGLLGRVKKWDLNDIEEQYLLDVGFTSILCDHLKIEFPGLDIFDKFPVPRKKKVLDTV